MRSIRMLSVLLIAALLMACGIAAAECDLFICIGGESDAWADDILESFDGDAPQVLRLIDCVDPIEEEEQVHMTHAGAHAKDETEYDEHIWTSPANAARMVSAVERAMRGISAVSYTHRTLPTTERV